MLEWYHCPYDGYKLCQIDPKEHIRGVYLKCKKCGNIIEIKNEIKLEPKPEPEPEPVIQLTG